MKYPKIKTVWKRDPDNKFKTLIKDQYATPEFEALADLSWIWTEKIDGTNIRVSWDGEHVTFAGRTDRAQIPVHLLNRLNTLFPTELFEKEYPELPMTLYGEGYGEKIQRGGLYGPVDFILFDILINDHWQERHNVTDIADHLKIRVVPIIGAGPFLQAINNVRAGLASVVAEKPRLAEGLVMHPPVELQDRLGQRIIAKIKTKDF